MVLNAKEFKEACQTILFAIDNKDVSLMTETLELAAEGNVLNLNVTNREYYARTKFTLATAEKFKAAVKAKTFLSLISKITTDTVELNIKKTSLEIKANGKYELPLIYNNDKMLELPEISLGTVTNTMDINSSTLLSIAVNNSKELSRGIPVKPVQKYYYVDKQGAITFTSGACVNTFDLPQDVKLLLSDKVVRLFKLFKSDNNVSFSMGQNPIGNGLVQTVVQFSTDKVCITAKMSDTGLISSVPVSAIRSTANKVYPYTMVLDKNQVLQTLNRIIIFNEDKFYGNLTFNNNSLTIQDFNGGGTETITASSETTNISEYKMILDLKNLKLILDGCDDDYITMCFGDSKAVVVKKNNICDIIPEIKVA